MAYADYSFYKETWGGAMPEADFPRMVTRAGYQLDCITQNRAPVLLNTGTADDKKALSMAACALVDMLYISNKTGGKELVSESMGKHSVSYAAPERSEQARMRSAVKPYLCGLTVDGVGLLYRGIQEGCGHGLF